MFETIRQSIRITIVTSCAMVLIFGGCSSESSDWENAQKKGTPDAMREFVKRYPSGQFSQAATDKLDDLEYEQVESTGTVAALETYLVDHKSSRHFQKAQQRRDVLLTAKAYHWSPNGPLAKEGANDFEITENNNHTRSAKATSVSSHMPGTMALGAGPAAANFFFEGLGSKNIRIQPSKELGYTTYAGLRFEAEAVVAIRDDGRIEVDREGVMARDEKGGRFVSRKVEVDGTVSILMLEPL